MTETPRRLGRYQLDQVIGTGAFAAVHLATDERLDDRVAVKLLADNHALDPDVRERFIAEGRFLRRIESPHVVRVHDIGETDDRQPFLVLEHADRGTLARRVDALRRDGRRPDPDDIGIVARALAGAVEAVHRADLVHRDLSPGNILLRSTTAPRDGGGDGQVARVVAADERVLLADLGLTKDLARHSGLTRATGTEGFRPPEQQGRAGRVDQRADLWAVSALMVWLITGEPPGDRAVAVAVVEAGQPERLGQTLARGLEDEPDRRHRDIGAWIDEVEAALQPAAHLSPDLSPATTAQVAPATSRSRRRSMIRSAAILAVGAGLGAVGWTALGPEPDDGATVTRLDGDRVEVEREVGGARLTLVGPDEVPVGDEAVFEIDGEGLDRWVWLMPDGSVYDDASSVRVQTASAGEARVILVGFAESGARVELVHDLRVR